RELDFFIKNEIMDIDAIGTEDEKSVDSYLNKVRVIKNVSKKIIEFLAQIENFQKKLFEKKKFVIDDEYCLTLDKVPEVIQDEIFEEVLNNKKQINEWKVFFNEKIETKDDLFINKSKLFNERKLKNLVVDTKYFNNDFKEKLLDSYNNVNDEIKGLMINSENFQTLNLIMEKYKGKVKAIFIDPPYNTGGEDFVYKDNYQHSSWLTMMENRLKLASKLMANNGVVFISIDDNEHSNLKKLCDEIFGKNNFVSNIIWQKKYSPQNDARYFSDNHDFILAYAKNKDNWDINLLPRTEEMDERYKNPDNDPRGPWKSSDLSVKRVTPKDIYEIRTPSGRKVLPPQGRSWVVSEEKFEEMVEDNRIWFGEDGNNVPSVKRFLSEVKDGITPMTIWTYEEVGHNQEAKQELKALLNEEDDVFDTPKTLRLIKRILRIASNKNDIVMDFFAGSGTTGHACLDLNEEDDGERKYIQVELGNYFYTTMLPRIKKVMYSKEWKDDKPQDNDGYSHFFKYQSIEQYEDTLENIEFESNNLKLINNYDDYLIKYMLDYDTKFSVINIDKFKEPFNYEIIFTENKEKINKKVNLIETFNYLIGLKVKTFDVYDQFDRKYKVVSGKKDDESVLVIWRKTIDLDLKKDKEFIENKLNLDNYKKVYINGDNYVEKSLLIEESFKKLMLND
ncbi:MAG: site-specific DNA-methyltransferase, partial [bacterium]